MLMVQKSGDHQLRLVVYPMIYKLLYIPDGAGFLPSTVVSFRSNRPIFIEFLRTNVHHFPFPKPPCLSSPKAAKAAAP